MRELAYARPRNLDRLHEELIAAGLPPAACLAVAGEPDGVRLIYPDGVDEAAVAAVVAAHDRAAGDAADAAARAAEAQDRAELRGAVAALLADAARLEDGLQALTPAQLRPLLARTNRALAAALRTLARRGL